MTKWARTHEELVVEYRTASGASLVGKSEELLQSPAGKALVGQVQLVFTSPPFPLNRKKKYGNLAGADFKRWLRRYAVALRDLLTPDGAIVLEMGNAWEPRLPVMSTLAMETLLEFRKAADLYLCQEFVWYNNAKLPTPAQWVTVNRFRVKDAFTRIWWLSPTAYPKADTRRVLQPYSGSMKSLLRSGKYNSGRRPSEHVIGAKSFLTDNGGAIPPNVLTVPNDEAALDDINNILVGANTDNADSYHAHCRKLGVAPHPARMPIALAKFFVNLCTDAGDIVFDPFGGSNTTGAAAEQLERQWITVEANPEYAKAGIGRFPSLVDTLEPTSEELTNHG